VIAKSVKKKGILTKLLEKGLQILLIKECKKIGNLKIDIISSTTQIIKGTIDKIYINAEDINYKDILFDNFFLEANQIKIKFNLINKELHFINNPIIELKISISQNSLRSILSSNNWSWIGNMISQELLNKERLEVIKISNNKLLIKTSKENVNINKVEKINIKSYKGKIYMENKKYDKTIQIPIEDKIYIKNIYIENNLINIFANSSISF
tara:strand:- start:93 stop:725 length:633 start_codon:yes stop_codon:yes gene_type:complete